MVSSGNVITEPGGTRDALLDAGRRLLLSKESFSMGAVAKRAGVSRQAVYLHFADRFALLEAIVDQLAADSSVDSLRREIRDAQSARAALGHLLSAMLRITASHGELDRAVRHTLASDAKLAERWAQRRGRGAMVRLVAERLEAEGALREGLGARAGEAILGAFLSPEFLVRLVGAVPADEAERALRRSVSAAILARGQRIPARR